MIKDGNKNIDALTKLILSVGYIHSNLVYEYNCFQFSCLLIL